MGQICREPEQGSASGPGRPYAAVEQRANGRPGTPAEADQTPNVWSCEVRPLGAARAPRCVTDQERNAMGDESRRMRLHGKCGRPVVWTDLDALEAVLAGQQAERERLERQWHERLQ